MYYQTTLDGITAEMLIGFFDDWGTNYPTPEKHLELLQKSTYIVLGIEDQRVVGFITAVSDGVLAAYIPFLEVLPEYKHQGIGKTLVTRMLEGLRDYYMVDLCCDDDLVGFYQSFQMAKGNGMMIRHYRNQAGK